MGVTILTVSTIVPGLRPPPCSADGVCIRANGTQLSVLYLDLYLTALGTGGLKSSVSGFGSNQFDEASPKEKPKMISFSWFFFFISIGSLAAVTILVYIQDNLGRKWGYGICACAILAALVVFLSGTKRYRFKKLMGSPITQITRVFFAAWKNRSLELHSDPSLLYQGDLDSAGKKMPTVNHTKQFRKVVIIYSDTALCLHFLFDLFTYSKDILIFLRMM